MSYTSAFFSASSARISPSTAVYTLSSSSSPLSPSRLSTHALASKPSASSSDVGTSDRASSSGGGAGRRML